MIELIFADMEVIEKRLPKIRKRAELKLDKEAVIEYEILLRLNQALKDQTPIRALNLTKDELKIIKNFSFLTAKPMVYVCNVSDDELSDFSNNEYVKKVEELANKNQSKTVVISAKIEQELGELEPEEREMFMEELGITRSGLDELVAVSYDLLGLKTFFTAGEQEVRAWTFKNGMKAPECAGIIHTDFQKGFIRAETISYEDLIVSGSETKAKENGKFRLEGKDYIAKDGDVFHFRFNL